MALKLWAPAAALEEIDPSLSARVYQYLLITALPTPDPANISNVLRKI